MKNFILFIAMLCITITTTFAQRETVEKKLRVTDNFRYTATTPDSGKVLMAVDAQGNSIWQSVAAIGPCCFPDTLTPGYIVLPNCTTVTNNRNELLIVTPDAQITSTACDTLQYLYIDTVVANYLELLNGGFIPLAGTDSLKPVTGDILYAKNYDHWALEYRDPNEQLDKTGIYLDDGNFSFRGISGNNFINFGFGGTLDGFTISTNSFDSIPTFFGITGDDYFGANYTDFTYIQKKYVDDNSPIITSGSGAPATTPAKIGDLYIDTSNRKLYFAVGTTNSGDWEISN